MVFGHQIDDLVKEMTEKRSPAARRFYKMSLREVSAECARLHISYGQASLMAQNGTLPEEFGRRSSR